MKKIGILIAFIALLFVATPASAQTIDGTLSAGEWDSYHLGTYHGDFDVDVYGFTDANYLYAAYMADISDPDWATSCTLNINGNFYYKTPDSASWPEEGYTILEMVYPRVMQTDDTDWADLGLPSSNGITSGYTDMYSVSTSDCIDGTAGAHMAEFKIPLSLLTYAGDDGQIKLSGQYWQYGFSDAVYVSLPDTVAPLVEISSPTDGSYLSGMVDIAGYVTDDVELSHYNLSLYPGTTDLSDGDTHSGERLNDSNWCTTPTSGTVNLSSNFTGNFCTGWDTTNYPDGDYQIRLAARDAALNRDLSDPYNGGTSSVHVISVTIDNTAPNITLVLPEDGKTYTGIIPFEATCDEDCDYINFWWTSEGSSFNSADKQYHYVTTNGTLFDWLLDTMNPLLANGLTGPVMPDGAYKVYAAGKDLVGNWARTETIVINVNNTPDNKDECKNYGWMSWLNPVFKNQGDCVSWVQSSLNALGNRKDNLLEE